VTAASPRWRAAITAALLAGCATRAPAPAPASPAAARPYVVLVSFDAFRHDYIDRFRPAAFESLAARGLRAESLVPPFPSKTFPSHYTLVTGLHPGHHGIAGNTFYDRARDAWYRLADTLAVRDGRWYRGEPIWVTAERQGVRTASYFWPGSEAEIGGVRPTDFRTYDARVPNDRRVDESIAWLRRAPDRRPHLVLLYMSDVDDTTHRHGPDAPQTARAVASVNRSLQRLLDSLAVLPIRDSVNVVLVSDHGMSAVSAQRVMPVLDALAAAGIDSAGIRTSDNGPTMSLWLADAATRDRVRAALARALAHADVYGPDDAPAHLHLAGEPRFGDLLVVARPGWILQRRGTDKPPPGGAHGWDPRTRDMHGIFVAAGSNVRPLGRVASLASVDVYGFIAAMLGLERLPVTDGDSSVRRFVRGY
jgi:predicted AlkP superfamily pyrophosphatase or phosphodiesterase